MTKNNSHSNPQTKKFTKTVENFGCEHCGHLVVGNGYTNHCPKCLWSKHVDIYPGDRLAKCQGSMEPVGVQVSGDRYTITHRCLKCGFVRNNKVLDEDDFEVVIAISKLPKAS